MGKNRRGKGRGQLLRGMRPRGPAPAEERWPRPLPPGGFRGPAPVRPMGPTGQRFPMGPHDFEPQPSRMMMSDDRCFTEDGPFHPLDRPDFHPSPFNERDQPCFFNHREFDDRPQQQSFYPPEFECNPRYFNDGPPDFYPTGQTEFQDRPPNRHPSEFQDRPQNRHPSEFQDRPPNRHPSEFQDRPPNRHPSEFQDRPPNRHPSEFQDRPPNRHPSEFQDRPPNRHPSEFQDRPPNRHPSEFQDVCPPDFNDRPGFHRMNPELEPVDCYRQRDPNCIPPMNVHNNHAFGERRGFAGPQQDFQGPGPVPPQPQKFNAPNMPPPKKDRPPQPQKKKDPPKSTETKNEPPKTEETKKTSFKNITAKAPRGRSLGVITFVGNSSGFIERDDLRKFAFTFNVFIGTRAHLVPGVKVHFTVVKTLGKEVATDVKVAPGGIEDIDSTVYEGVVITALTDDNVKEPHPGRLRAIISVDPIKLPFGKADASVTLLLYDRVEFHLVTNVLTKEQRATNIKPKLPETFQLTKEIREMGVIVEKTNETLTIKTEKHDNLTASATEHLSEDELNVKDEVELTVFIVNGTQKAIRLKKLPEGTVTFNKAKCNKTISDLKENTSAAFTVKDKWKPVTSEAGSQESVSCEISSEKHEGTIVKIATKNSQTQEKEADKQEPALGLLVSVVEGTDKKLPFRSADVITKATMMVGDKVQFNISTNNLTKEERAVNVEILPNTFQAQSEEQRKMGHVIKLNDNTGFIKTQQHPQLFFDMSEVMEETKLALFEKVEYTIAPNEAGGSQAVRIRRLNENVFTSAPKLEALGVKEKQKKMTIKLLQDSKDRIKDDVKTEGKDGESNASVKPNTEKVNTLPSMTLMEELKKERDINQEKVKKDGRAQSRDGDSRRRCTRSRSRDGDRRRRSRSRSRDADRRRRSHSRSRSRDRSIYRRHRSSSRERRDSRYRRSRSRERYDRYRRSNSRSRSRERSSRNARKRSHSPENKDDRHKKLTSREPKRSASPVDNVDEEILKKKKELMELNELIARKKAIAAMEQNSQRFEVEVEGQCGVKTFDYQHCENVWMPELKPVKSILKKQSELHSDPHDQASASTETAQFVQHAGIPFASVDSQRASAFDSSTPFYSTENSLTTAGPKNMPIPQTEDPELQRKKKQLDDLSESIARKRAIIAFKHKTRDIQEVPIKTECDLDSDSEDQLILPKESLWSTDVKSNVQPKKSILKKRSEPLGFQSDTTSVDDYGQVRPSHDDSLFIKPSLHSTASFLFNKSLNPQPVRSDTLGLFNKIRNESSATSHMTEPPTFNKPVVPKSLAQASDLRSLRDQKPVSKGNPEVQHKVISSQTHDHSHNDSPSISQTLPSDQKRNVTTQMERFLSALNKADSNIVNSLIQEARKGLPLLIHQKSPQPQLDRNIPFMDEIYDPFKEDDDSDEPSPLIKDAGRHSVQKGVRSPIITETHLEDPSHDDLLPHERAVQDGSGFSQLVGTKPTAKPERKLPYGQVASDNWNTADKNWLSEEWNPYKKDNNLYSTGQRKCADDPSLYRESSRPAEYQGSYGKDREMPDKSLARQQSEESNEDEKEDQFEKIQNLLQTIGFPLDTGEVSKLADRTRERLYGKMVKPHSGSSHSFDRNREPSMSRSEREGSSRADSSDTDRLRSVSPAQSSNRKVYMSYKDSVKHQRKAEDVDLTSIKRTIVNLKSAEDVQDPSTPLPEQTAVAPALYQPAPAHVLSTAEAGNAQYAQNYNTATFPDLQYSYYSTNQNPWNSAYSLNSSQAADLQYSAYQYGTYGTMPPPANLGYANYHQAAPPNMMSSYSSYPMQMDNPYSVRSSLLQVPTTNLVLLPTETKKNQPVRCLKTIQTVNVTAEAANTESVKQLMQTRLKAELEEAEKKQVATITEDDIKAKQKKRLEQFNQRMKLKKVQQMEAQRSRGQKQNSTPGKGTPSEIKNVWICGHSLVFWAEKRANSLEFGGQLGLHPNLARIWWKGVQGMTWKQLVPLLLQLKDNWPKPDVIIVHLGGNDISTTAPDVFIQSVKKDFASLQSIFPRCLLVWSDMLSRQTWRDAHDSKEMDLVRMAINDGIHYVMTNLGGAVLTHNNIRPSAGLYRPDGVHLSGKGIDTFNLNLQDFLLKWEIESETNTESAVQNAKS